MADTSAAAAAPLAESELKALIVEGKSAFHENEQSYRAFPQSEHLVTYRLSTVKEAASGASYAQRREHLVALMETLDGRKVHFSTSAWKVRVRQPAAALAKVLATAIDPDIDALAVIPAPADDKIAFIGNPDLDD